MSDLKDYNRKIRQDLLIDFRDIQYHTTWGLFSPRTIDDGSRMLLDYLDVKATDRCLDLGCGYGVLGFSMARSARPGHSLLIDKDFVDAEFIRRPIVERLH